MAVEHDEPAGGAWLRKQVLVTQYSLNGPIAVNLDGLLVCSLTTSMTGDVDGWCGDMTL